MLLFFLLILFGIQNRSGIMALIISFLFYFLVFKIKSTMTIKKILLFLLAVISIILFIPFIPENVLVLELINKGLMLDILEQQGISQWSSARMGMNTFGWNLFKENPLFGTSDALTEFIYIESFYVQSLALYGLFGIILFLIYLFTILINLLKAVRNNFNDTYTMASFMLLICMLFIAAFEQLAPLVLEEYILYIGL
ncbi:O-antigen ligase family protein [Bacillus sp. N9]